MAIGKKKPKTAYEQALANLDAAKQLRPIYRDTHKQQREELYGQIVNRPKFSYDTGSDALYQHYKQSYAEQGRMAMRDTMGQAAALTGGYGSSYGQSVGQQQYNAYLQKLSEVFPQTYQMAYDAYTGEGEALQKQYDMVQELSEEEYSRYQNSLSAYYQQIAQLQERADVAYNRQQQEEQTAYNRKQDEEETAYKKEQDAYKRQQEAYTRLADMMLTLGYVPNEEEMKAAAMSQKAMEAYRSYYEAANKSSGSSTTRRSSSKNTAEKNALNTARETLRRTGDIEAVNGSIAQKVSRGELTPEAGRKIITTLTKEHYGK